MIKVARNAEVLCIMEGIHEALLGISLIYRRSISFVRDYAVVIVDLGLYLHHVYLWDVRVHFVVPYSFF